ncbi:MAG: caspase family protein [Deltaproteobacteria bacterium]|nr:MAG: caspase family protein [Deltaproteobacteria bacterium]
MYPEANVTDRNRYALVIGSETEGLAGAIHDAGCMATVLAKNYGFTVESRIGGDATRDGILDGYNRLIGRVAGGDAAVVYYAGHGSFSFNRDPDDPIRTVQAIIPVDHKRGAPNFQAITAWELGILLQKLTDRTQNVTVILDCCHSSQMSRDAAARQAVPRSLPHPLRTSFREHLTALEKLYGDVELDPVGNPHAVRLVACAQTESAWEYANADGKRTGVFTEALIEVLTEIGNAAISWAAVGNAVRERVLKHFEHQRPDVEGPSERQLFTLTPDRRTGAVPVTMTGGELVIHTGEVLGTARGDTYAAMPLGSESYDATKVIAELKVLEVAPLMSTVTAAWKNGHGHLPDDAVAIPVALAAPTHPVVVIAPDTEREAIAAALRVARTLGIATAEEAGTAIAILRLADAQLVIEDPAGPIFPPARYPQDLADAVKNLANLGVARRVRDMVGEHGLSGAGLDISWGVVQSGQEQPMPDHGASLGLHDRIYVKVKNTTGDPRYIHIFNVGVRGKVTLLTRNLAPAGFKLDSNIRELVLGQRNAKLAGLPLGWPMGLPETFPRIDSLFVFVTTTPVGLHPLETQDYVVRGGRRGPGSKLQDLLAQVQDGLPRAVTREIGEEPLEGFFVQHLSYQLHPRKAAIADTVTYQVDENPQGRASARSADAWLSIDEARRATELALATPAPEAISIRIGELVVERNRAMFSADVRIDALVCTRSANQPEAYAAHTMRFQGIQDGQRLPLQHARIFHGPVRDFVDICLWVSRDTTRDRDLAELFASRAGSEPFRDATTALLTTASVTAAPWIAAVGASAALGRIAYDLILAIEQKTIGLYRTSFLAGERFGVGRHPTEGLYRAQDFSFSLLIDQVPAAA